MKFFIDTADTREIRRAAGLGVLDGVTMSSALVAREGQDLQGLLREIVTLVNGPICVDVTTGNQEEMLGQARELARIHPNVVVRVPMTADGLQACRQLRAEGIKIDVSLCFSPGQALLAAKAGANYVSAAVGRLDSASHDGTELIGQIRAIFDNYAFDTEILADSLRHTRHVVDCALAGADGAAMPFEVVTRLLEHPLTELAQESFLADWNKANG